MSRPVRLGVVGGGAAAVSLLDGLLRHGRDGGVPPLEITLYEPAAAVGTGRAYRPDLDCALVNREAGFMSVRSADRGHFLRWLHASERHRGTAWAGAGL